MVGRNNILDNVGQGTPCNIFSPFSVFPSDFDKGTFKFSLLYLSLAYVSIGNVYIAKCCRGWVLQQTNPTKGHNFPKPLSGLAFLFNHSSATTRITIALFKGFRPCVLAHDNKFYIFV